MSFKNWANQEMQSHGSKISFKDWLSHEVKKHGNATLKEWGHDEMKSHNKRYGAEGFAVFGGRGFQIKFDNGYKISIMFGVGNYADHHRGEITMEQWDKPPLKHESRTAEVAVIKPDGDFVRIGANDDVAGWLSPSEVSKLIAATATGDETKIQNALSLDSKSAEGSNMAWNNARGFGESEKYLNAFDYLDDFPGMSYEMLSDFFDNVAKEKGYDSWTDIGETWVIGIGDLYDEGEMNAETFEAERRIGIPMKPIDVRREEIIKSCVEIAQENLKDVLTIRHYQPLEQQTRIISDSDFKSLRVALQVLNDAMEMLNVETMKDAETFEAMEENNDGVIVCSSCGIDVESDRQYGTLTISCGSCGNTLYKDDSYDKYYMGDFFNAENDDDDLSDCQVCGEMFVSGALNQHPTTLYTVCYECFENELEEDDEGWVDVEDFTWDEEDYDAETFEARGNMNIPLQKRGLYHYNCPYCKKELTVISGGLQGERAVCENDGERCNGLEIPREYLQNFDEYLWYHSNHSSSGIPYKSAETEERNFGSVGEGNNFGQMRAESKNMNTVGAIAVGGAIGMALFGLITGKNLFTQAKDSLKQSAEAKKDCHSCNTNGSVRKNHTQVLSSEYSVGQINPVEVEGQNDVHGAEGITNPRYTPNVQPDPHRSKSLRMW